MKTSFCILLLLFPTFCLSQLSTPAVDTNFAIIDINTIEFWMNSNGTGGYIRFDDYQMAFYPKGTGSIIFTDGMIWGVRSTTVADRLFG
jgi:hypothetical protein